MPEGPNQRQFSSWLKKIGCEQYAEAFEREEIDFDILADLSDQDLMVLGFDTIGKRKRFLKLVKEQTATPDPKNETLPQGERRQVTVLFADIAGYTSLSSQRDPEEIHQILNTYFDIVDQIIHQHGGAIDKHIGDAVMAIFGAPIAHTDDPLRAVLSALEIHQKLGELDEPIGVHIGIASGEVVASGTGSDEYAEYTVTGSTVNLASRLDGLANTGETFVNENVYQSVADRVLGESKGAVQVKGFSQPVTVWSITGLCSIKSPHSQVEIWGRKRECENFSRALEKCLGQGQGKLFYLRGEPGIGKSCLAEAFHAKAKEAGFSCIDAMVLDFGSATGERAIQTLTQHLIDPNEENDFEELPPIAVQSELCPTELETSLYDLLGIAQPEHLRAIFDAMDDENRRRGRHKALKNLIDKTCATKPIFIWFDNLHWVGKNTLSLLHTLAQQAPRNRLLLVYTSRIEGDPWTSDTTTERETLELRSLTQEDAQRMALDYGLEDNDYASLCWERAGGNPLFLEQLYRGAAQGKKGDLPSSVQSVVLARLDELKGEDRRALQAASVMGQHFSLAILRDLLGQPDYECHELVRSALIRPDGEDFLFTHALVVEGIYNSLLSDQRKGLHEKVAAWHRTKDPTLHAQHLDRAENPDAVTAYQEAANAETHAYRYEAALQLVDRGLELSATPSQNAALLCLKGTILLSLGDTERSLIQYKSALEASENPSDQTRALLGVAACSRIVGAVDRGKRTLAQIEEVGGGKMSALERAQAEYYRGSFLFSDGDIKGAIEAQTQAINHAREADVPEWIAKGLSGLADAQYASGKFKTAHGIYRECIALCQTHGLGQIEVANRAIALNMQRYMNEFSAAIAGIREVLHTARQVGNLRAEMFGGILLGEFLTDQAEYQAALAPLTRSEEIVNSFGNQRMRAYVLNHQARALAAMGDTAQALNMIKQAWEISRATDPTFFGARLCGTRALISIDEKERTTALEDGEKILKKGVLAHNVIWFLRDAIETSLNTQNWDTALSYTDRLEDHTKLEPIPWCDYFINRGRVLASHGKGENKDKELNTLKEITTKIGLLACLPPPTTAQ